MRQPSHKPPRSAQQIHLASHESPPVEPRQQLTATVIPADQHPVRPEKIDPDALFVLKKLNAAGFAAYLVGGGVRDLYLGRQPKDFDISTEARPGQIRKLFPHSATIGRRFRLVQVFFRHGKVIEVSTLRSLSEHDLDSPEAVLAPNNSFGTLEEDAQRRDLTINSLFFDIRTQTVIDYVGGVDDLSQRTIRLVGNPDQRLHTDPVRILRAIRHAARTGFTIDAASWRAIVHHRHKLALCPPSRIRDEILKDLHSGSAASWFRLCSTAGIVPVVLPLYRKIFGKKTAAEQQCSRQMSDLLEMLDRLRQDHQPNNKAALPDVLLFALLLLPYAEHTYQLYSEKRPSAQLYHLAKKLRDDIDSELGNSLNLPRALRQETTALLTQLAQLIHNRSEAGWPKWLQHKSYFAQASLLYHCYNEAIHGVVTDRTTLHEHLPQQSLKEHAPIERTPDSGRRTRPALSPAQKGGIFGLKK